MRRIDPGEADCWLDADDFESILDQVKGNEQFLITFDDGNSSDFEIALPALLRRNMKAVFFVCSGRIGLPTFLNQNQIRELDANGMTIGSHGALHRPWRPLAQAELQHEITDSRRVLEDMLSKNVVSAACPFGDYDRRVLKVLRNAGYSTVYTSDGGECRAQQWLKPRTTIRRSYPPDRLKRILDARLTVSDRLINSLRIMVKKHRQGPSGFGK
jgi:peptidoglycan/xylan/chitin deacetylase (PgdA/CDA1 family)